MGMGGRPKRKPVGGRGSQVNDIPKESVDRLTGLMDLDPDEIRRIAQSAWGHAVGLRDAQKAISTKEWNKLGFRKRQKAILEFSAGIIESTQYQCRYTQWCLENPGDAMRMFLSTVPKEVQATVTVEGNVVLLPAKMGSVQEWLSEVKVAENVIDVEPTDG